MPRPPPREAPATWDVLVAIVSSIDVSTPGPRGPIRHRVEATAADRARVRAEVAAFVRRVRQGTDGRLEIRARIVTVPGPLTVLAGPGPYWIDAASVADLLPKGEDPRDVDTLMAFVKIGEDEGPAVPVRHLGGAVGGDRCPGGACFAGITYRPRWLLGDGTVALHEWLHGLDWALTEVSGFPDEAIPDPDEGRAGPTCCPDAPAGDGPFADHILRRHLTPEMIRAADARRGPAVRDGYLRGWTVAGAPRDGAWRTVTLPAGARTARAALPAGTGAVEVFANQPVEVRVDRGDAVRVASRGRVEARGRTLTVTRALPASEVRFRVRLVSE